LFVILGTGAIPAVSPAAEKALVTPTGVELKTYYDFENPPPNAENLYVVAQISRKPPEGEDKIEFRPGDLTSRVLSEEEILDQLRRRLQFQPLYSVGWPLFETWTLSGATDPILRRLRSQEKFFAKILGKRVFLSEMKEEQSRGVVTYRQYEFSVKKIEWFKTPEEMASLVARIESRAQEGRGLLKEKKYREALKIFDEVEGLYRESYPDRRALEEIKSVFKRDCETVLKFQMGRESWADDDYFRFLVSLSLDIYYRTPELFKIYYGGRYEESFKIKQEVHAELLKRIFALAPAERERLERMLVSDLLKGYDTQDSDEWVRNGRFLSEFGGKLSLSLVTNYVRRMEDLLRKGREARKLKKMMELQAAADAIRKRMSASAAAPIDTSTAHGKGEKR